MRAAIALPIIFPAVVTATTSNQGKNNAAVAIIQQAGYNDLPPCAQSAVMHDLKSGIPGCSATDIVCYCRNQDVFTFTTAHDAAVSCDPNAPAGTTQNGVTDWAGRFCTLAQHTFT